MKVKSLLLGIGAALIAAGVYATAPPPKPATAKFKTLHAYTPMQVFGKVASAIPVEPVVDSGTLLSDGAGLDTRVAEGWGGLTLEGWNVEGNGGRHGRTRVASCESTISICDNYFSRNHPS